MVGKQGRVTAFYAYPSIPGEAFQIGDQVIVVDYQAPRTVYVARAV
jgi:hypothetical protein